MKGIKIVSILFISFVLFLSCSKKENDIDEQEVTYYRGADLSFLPMIKQKSTKFYAKNGSEINLIDFLKEKGMNIVRIRIWHTPENNHSSFEEVKAFSNLVKSKGLLTWLSVHYSDNWADPGNQQKPVSWVNLSFEVLKDSVFQYTKKIIREIQPNIIQIGNETNDGFLWPEGKLSLNKQQYLDLTQEGINAVREYGNDVKIMLQYAGHDGSEWFFDQVNSLDYDMIGLSYYPWWHGKNIDDLTDKMTLLKRKYAKDILIAETAYPFTLEWNDWTNNVVGLDEQLILPEYPANEEGQKKFFHDLTSKIKHVGGVGHCYWAPEWVAWNGPESKEGSSWENLCLFDFENIEIEALNVFFSE